MNNLLSRRGERGAVLMTTLVIALLVSIAAGALIFVSQQQNYMTTRSTSWVSEIPIAEAGIEEAMSHLNSRPRAMNRSGWSTSGDGKGVFKSRSIGSGNGTNGYFYTTISTDKPPVIVSIGYARIPKKTNFTYRTVVALTKLLPPAYGFVAKSTVSMNGNPFIDSYDSSDPDFSTNGKWDTTKRRDRVGVASISSLKPAITTGSNGKIYGAAATGPGGTVSGAVGDGDYLATSSGQQAGHVTDDFNMAVPNPTLPSPWNPQTTPQYNTNVGGVLYDYYLAAGDWQFNGDVYPSGSGIYVAGKVRVYITGGLKMTSTTAITLAPGATLELYIGTTMDLAGSCVINPTGIPNNCVIYGMSTTPQTWKYAGTAEAYCRIYAPNANLTITGDFDFSGSAVANTLSFSGTANVHYDEALRGGPEYQIVSWEEK